MTTNALTQAKQKHERTLGDMMPDLADALNGTMIKPSQLKVSALSAISANSSLMSANPLTLQLAILSAAHLGLLLEPSFGRGYLIPFGNKAQLVVGYLGYEELAARAGVEIRVEVVRMCDTFEQGNVFDKEPFIFKPAIDKNRSEYPIRCVVGALFSHEKQSFSSPAVMDKEGVRREIEHLTRKAMSQKTRPKWFNQNENENSRVIDIMIAKKLIRRLGKSVPIVHHADLPIIRGKESPVAYELETRHEGTKKVTNLEGDGNITIQGENGETDTVNVIDALKADVDLKIRGGGKQSTCKSVDEWVQRFENARVLGEKKGWAGNLCGENAGVIDFIRKQGTQMQIKSLNDTISQLDPKYNKSRKASGGAVI